MPAKQAENELVRVEIKLPKNLLAAARKRVGDRGLSRLIGQSIADVLRVPYTPPPLGRRTKESAP
jgi:hypothetical protein